MPQTTIDRLMKDCILLDEITDNDVSGEDGIYLAKLCTPIPTLHTPYFQVDIFNYQESLQFEEVVYNRRSDQTMHNMLAIHCQKGHFLGNTNGFEWKLELNLLTL